jgi:hypothetical protein
MFVSHFKQSPLYTVEEFSRQLVDSKSKFIVTVPMFLEKALESAKVVKINNNHNKLFFQPY